MTYFTAENRKVFTSGEGFAVRRVPQRNSAIYGFAALCAFSAFFAFKSYAG
jgi:hypothetical protein